MFKNFISVTETKNRRAMRFGPNFAGRPFQDFVCNAMQTYFSETPNVTPTDQGHRHMSVSKNRGKTPKWMVKIMENPIEIHDLGSFPLFLETP